MHMKFHTHAGYEIALSVCIFAGVKTSNQSETLLLSSNMVTEAFVMGVKV